MGTPAHQLTVRIRKEDVTRLDNLLTSINGRSFVSPAKGDVLRTIFMAGVVAIEAELRAGGAKLPPSASAPPPDSGYAWEGEAGTTDTDTPEAEPAS